MSDLGGGHVDSELLFGEFCEYVLEFLVERVDVATSVLMEVLGKSEEDAGQRVETARDDEGVPLESNVLESLADVLDSPGIVLLHEYSNDGVISDTDITGSEVFADVEVELLSSHPNGQASFEKLFNSLVHLVSPDGRLVWVVDS